MHKQVLLSIAMVTFLTPMMEERLGKFSIKMKILFSVASLLRIGKKDG